MNDNCPCKKKKCDIENVLSFWAALDGVHLHSNGEEFYEHIGWKEETLVKVYGKLV